MSDARPRFLCDAVATAVNDNKLFITVYQVGDGIEFSSGRGDVKHGSPRRYWTNADIKREIALVYGAKTVELMHPRPAPGKQSHTL